MSLLYRHHLRLRLHLHLQNLTTGPSTLPNTAQLQCQNTCPRPQASFHTSGGQLAQRTRSKTRPSSSKAFGGSKSKGFPSPTRPSSSFSAPRPSKPPPPPFTRDHAPHAGLPSSPSFSSKPRTPRAPRDVKVFRKRSLSDVKVRGGRDPEAEAESLEELRQSLADARVETGGRGRREATNVRGRREATERQSGQKESRERDIRQRPLKPTRDFWFEPRAKGGGRIGETESSSLMSSLVKEGRSSTSSSSTGSGIGKVSVEDTLKSTSEFYHPPQPVSTIGTTTLSPSVASTSTTSTSTTFPTHSRTSKPTRTLALPTRFTSPPILPSLLRSLHELIGEGATPTPIQALAIRHILEESRVDEGAAKGAEEEEVQSEGKYRQFLLAAETGSGKSIAYLLPLLHHIKLAEIAARDAPHPPPPPSSSPTPEVGKPASKRAHNPRGLILAPTHELARQLSSVGKALLHETKLRVLCASRANVRSTQKVRVGTARKMRGMVDGVAGGVEWDGGEGEGEGVSGKGEYMHPTDVLVGTPMKVLEMVRGRGWDRVHTDVQPSDDVEGAESVEGSAAGEGEGEETPRLRRGRDFEAGYGNGSKPELGLANIEWVVIDEADVLFDPDFEATTRLLLADISKARGCPVPTTVVPPTTTTTSLPTPSTPIAYPFNLILTSATIPNALNAHLASHHPHLVRLASPRLHKLPRSLHTEHVAWTGGNKFADVLRRVRRVWAEDAALRAARVANDVEGEQGGEGEGDELSKIIIFCNKSAKVIELCAYLEEHGVKSVPMTSASEHRGRGSNRHLAGFLRTASQSNPSQSTPSTPSTTPSSASASTPHILITTSLLSRGLDFSPQIKHVLIVDEPRNMVDFLHRAGRTGRAGGEGKVVVFGKMSGRGSERGWGVRRRVGALGG